MPCSEDDDSQNEYRSEPVQGMSKAELRKTNKPIMEKKRRARINHCLNELKDLLMDAMDKDPSRHSKLEKADILEMTVKHLQTLQRQQLAAAIAADPAVLHRFRSGFGDCAVEVRRYLSRLASVPTGLRYRLSNHLTSCISGIERLHPVDCPPIAPDPLRLDDNRPSAFHCVKSTKLTSPPLSPLSCGSTCDSSTELETPPRPVQMIPFPTPPSRSASDQDSSPETQKPTVSSTTISPEMLKQDATRNKKYMEPLSIVIDVENYKIGIDASPKRAVDYTIRHKLKRGTEPLGPPAKIMKSDHKDRFTVPHSRAVDLRPPGNPAFDLPIGVEHEWSIPNRKSFMDRKLMSSESLPVAVATHSRVLGNRGVPSPRTVINHTTKTLARSATASQQHGEKEKVNADNGPQSPVQGTSSSEMWRPW